MKPFDPATFQPLDLTDEEREGMDAALASARGRVASCVVCDGSGPLRDISHGEMACEDSRRITTAEQGYRDDSGDQMTLGVDEDGAALNGRSESISAGQRVADCPLTGVRR